MVGSNCETLTPNELIPTVAAEAPAANDGWAAVAVATAALP